jgi:LacI family transcriptional regulator
MKRFGVRDVARLANVSVGTVDRALNRRTGINKETRERILAIAESNSYAPNPTARALSFAKSTFRIGVCIPREIRYFYDQLYAGVVDEAKRYEHVGLEVVYRRVKDLSSPVSRAVNQLLDENIQALVVTPGRAQEVAPLIERAENDRNVRVVCVASDDSPTCRSTAISVDPILNGALAAEMMAKLVPLGSEVAIVTGMLITEEHRTKVEQFQKDFPIECQGGKTVSLIEGHEVAEEVYRKTLRLLHEYPNLRGIYISTVNCIPVCRAVEEQNRSGHITIIATDLFSDQEPYFRRRTLCASIYQDPYRQGQLAVRLVMDNFLNGSPFPKSYYINPVIAMRTNLGLFREMQGISVFRNGNTPDLPSGYSRHDWVGQSPTSGEPKISR